MMRERGINLAELVKQQTQSVVAGGHSLPALDIGWISACQFLFDALRSFQLLAGTLEIAFQFVDHGDPT